MNETTLQETSRAHLLRMTARRVFTVILLTVVCSTASYGQQDLQHSIDSIKKVIRYYDQKDSVHLLAVCRGNLMVIYYNNFMNDQYMAEVDDHLKWLEEKGEWSVYYFIQGIKVLTLIHQDKVQMATREAKTMMEHARQHRHEGGLALAYVGMADIYSAMGRYKEASAQYQKALAANTKKKNELYSTVMDNAYIMQASALQQLNQNEEQIKHCREWEAWLRSGVVGDGDFFHCRLANCQSVLAEALTALGRYAEAEKCLQRSAGYASKVQDHGLTVLAMYNLWASRSSYHLARQQAKEALACLDSMNQLMGGEKGAEMQRADALVMLGRGKEGADIYKRIIADKDSAFSHNMTKQLDELNALFRLDELQMQNTLQRTRFAVVFILLTALALIGFLLYRFFAVRRMERLKAKSERMESELRVAHEIQLGMVPSVFPAFPDHPEVEIYASVTPAKEVGGDLYDYAIHGGHLYFCLGDVSGKGVPASLLMTTAINLFRVASRQQLAPVDIAMQMNETLTENNDSGMFVTLFIGKVDLKTGLLDFCNCGHNPPVIIAEGKPRHIEMKTNIPLGIVPSYNYQNETYGCITGKPFFLYTDGLNEAKNAQGEQFGYQHIIDLLAQHAFTSCQDTIELMKSEVSLHASGTEQSDDLTMLCLKINN